MKKKKKNEIDEIAFFLNKMEIKLRVILKILKNKNLL